MAKERTSAAFKAFLGGVGAVGDIQNRQSREEEAEKNRSQAERLAEAQRKAVALNLKRQIDAANQRHQEQMEQAVTLYEKGAAHREELNAMSIASQIKTHEATIAAQKEAGKMNYNINQMRENMSYFQQYGVSPPARWKFDNKGLMLPAGHPSYWDGEGEGGNGTSGGVADRNLSVPDPTPFTQAANEAEYFPSTISQRINNIIEKKINNKVPLRMTGGAGYDPNSFGVYSVAPTMTMGVVGTLKGDIKPQDVVEGLSDDSIGKQINKAIEDLGQKANRNKKIINPQDKLDAGETLNAIGMRLAKDLEALNNPEVDINLSNKNRNKVAREILKQISKVQDLSKAYGLKIPSWGSTYPKEVIQRP